MTNKEMFVYLIVQMMADFIMYFAAYSTSVIILKNGVQSFGEAIILIFLVQLLLNNWHNGTKEASDTYDEDTLSKEEVTEAIKGYVSHKAALKLVAMTSALLYWAVTYTLIA